MRKRNLLRKAGITWQAKLLCLSLRALKERRPRSEISITKVRRRLRLVERIVPRPPAGTETAVGTIEGVNTVQIKVARVRSDRCVLYFHGGGYVVGSAALYRDFTWRIGKVADACVLYFDYRLAPEHPFPAAVEDATKVYGWLAGRIDPARIAFVGDSAGGGLALATAHKLRDEGCPLPAAVVALSPWTDLALTGPSLQSNAAADPMMNAWRLPEIANHYLDGSDPRHPYASPLYGVASGLPPVLIHAGGDEILRDDATRMADKLRGAGCDVAVEIWSRMPHMWHLYARVLPEARDAIESVGRFLRSKL
jgi:epsilon-lactone hydrolase